MNTKLLKLNNMKKFIYWLDINNVHPNTLNTFKHFPNSEEHKKVLKRLSQARSRNKFWDSRCKSRPNFNSDPHIPKRIAQFSKASELISYIIERNLRKS
tara:strand:- start:243 stop:539 length:297 start_codon:yes stop_codon:yes gene_type:complete